MYNYLINKFLQFKKGTIPLIISVPHGGTLDYDLIPERENGIFGIDKNTIELARSLMKLLNEIFYEKNTDLDHYPSFIISRIKRSLIDFNRKEIEAFNQQSEIARKLYYFYHDKIKDFINYNITNFGTSLLLDIHGFEKEKRPKGYRDVDIVLGTNNLKSITNVTLRKKYWDKNLRGFLINNFLDINITIAPGHSKRKEYVLTGGYITQSYGFSNIKNSKTIQIEFSDEIRVFNKDLKKKVLNVLAETIYEHLFKSKNL